MITDYTLLVPASPSSGPLLDNLVKSHEKYRNSFTNELVIFGAPSRSSCYHSKMVSMLLKLRELDTEYVVVIDAFDLIFNKPLDSSLFQDFEEIPDLEFKFGAEVNCFPYLQYKDLFDRNGRTSMKYLNGGVIIAKRDAYISRLESFLDGSKYDQGEFLRSSDQVMYTLMYKDSLEKGDKKVSIDQEARISLQMFRMEKDNHYVLDEKGQLRFLETDNIPFFVHFNGDGKNQMHHFGIEYGN